MQESKYYVDVLQNTDCTLHSDGYCDCTRIFVKYNLKINIFLRYKNKTLQLQAWTGAEIPEG
jgi:hypothetical protein